MQITSIDARFLCTERRGLVRGHEVVFVQQSCTSEVQRMGKRPLRCAGYIRVSTESQATEGVSLEAQAERVRAYAVVKGWVLSEILQDEASAKDLERPGVLNLLNLVRKRAVDVIIIYRLDRLTRSLVDLPAILKLLEQSGVELVSISESLDTTNATGRLMLNLLVSVSA